MTNRAAYFDFMHRLHADEGPWSSEPEPPQPAVAYSGVGHYMSEHFVSPCAAGVSNPILVLPAKRKTIFLAAEFRHRASLREFRASGAVPVHASWLDTGRPEAQEGYAAFWQTALQEAATSSGVLWFQQPGDIGTGGLPEVAVALYHGVPVVYVGNKAVQNDILRHPLAQCCASMLEAAILLEKLCR